MKDPQPLFNSATGYRIELQGRVDVEWLQNFDCSAHVSFSETGQMEDITVLNMHTDQSGIAGLVCRLHCLGMTILQVQVVLSERKAAEGEEQLWEPVAPGI